MTTSKKITLTCGFAQEFTCTTQHLRDLVKDVRPDAKVKFTLSLESGTMGATYALLEVEEAE
jgi:hypothetical protein